MKVVTVTVDDAIEGADVGKGAGDADDDTKELYVGGKAPPQALTTLPSSVTAVPAYSPPWLEAPVVRVMAPEARMLPANLVAPPRVAAVPTIQ